MTRTLIALVVLLLHGCAAPRIVGTVQGLATPQAATARRFMMGWPKGVPEGDLQYASYANQVAAALRARGWTQDTQIQTDLTELVVLVRAQIGEPQQMSSTSTIPIVGQTGVADSTTTGTISPNGSFSSTTSYSPTYGIVDFVPVTNTWLECERLLRVDAYDLTWLWRHEERAKRPLPVWSATVRSRGNTCNLPTVFPYLVKLSAPAVATNFGPRDLQVEMVSQ